MNSKISCGVVGARGYSGMELMRLLKRHPSIESTQGFASQGEEFLPHSKIMDNLSDVMFLATPAEVSLELAPKILAAGKKIIDLSGAFRLKRNDYKTWYGFDHTEKNLLPNAVYGLSPWAGPYRGESLIANPGCYATAILSGLVPLLKSNLIDPDHIVIDAKSGSTGGGKKAAENLLFSEVDGECLPYKIGKHQHLPEIQEALEDLAHTQIQPHLVTSLIPVRRGIIAGIYTNLRRGKSLVDVQNAYTSDYPLLRHAHTVKESRLLTLKSVVGTPYIHISYEVVGDKLFVFSCIDNLLKGAASQAIENLNRILDKPVNTGLEHLEAYL